jgi:adenine deaminase
VGHDAHNVVVAGDNEDDMNLVIAEVARTQGGVVVVSEGKVLARIDLPVAGLLSDKRAPVVAGESSLLKKAWADLGCLLPFMGFNLLPLSVIPEIRLTDKGLVTVPGMEIVPLFS